MPTFDTMTLEEVEKTMEQLRSRRRTLKQSGKVTERKIGTLARRREHLMESVRVIDDNITALRQLLPVEPPVPPKKRRGRRPKSALAAQ